MRAMMANNYAKALYELEIPRADISDAAETVKKNPELAKVLASPAVSREEKHGVINAVFPKSTHNFINYLCDRSHSGMLLDIIDAYYDYSDEQQRVIHAVLTCVNAPDEERLGKIKDFIRKKFNGTDVLIDIKYDKSLIGGFILTAGGIEFDRSLRSSLMGLKNSMKRSV